MIFAGQLRDKLSFYQIEEVQSESGFKHIAEVFLFSTKAERLKNKESYAVDADELFHITELKFRLRYRKEITETCLVQFEGSKYRITSLEDRKQDNEMIITLGKVNE